MPRYYQYGCGGSIYDPYYYGRRRYSPPESPYSSTLYPQVYVGGYTPGYSSTQLTSPGWVAPTYPPQYAPSDIPPRPMSYSNPSTTSSETRRYFVKVPEGVSRGQIFTVLLDGFEHTVHCPNESNSGDTIIVTASPNAVHARTRTGVAIEPNSVYIPDVNELSPFCPACTYENQFGSLKCEVCFTGLQPNTPSGNPNGRSTAPGRHPGYGIGVAETDSVQSDQQESLTGGWIDVVGATASWFADVATTVSGIIPTGGTPASPNVSELTSHGDRVRGTSTNLKMPNDGGDDPARAVPDAGVAAAVPGAPAASSTAAARSVSEDGSISWVL